MCKTPTKKRSPDVHLKNLAVSFFAFTESFFTLPPTPNFSITHDNDNNRRRTIKNLDVNIFHDITL